MKIKTVLPLEKETKGALLYRSKSIPDSNPLYLLDGLYVRKAGMAAAIGSNSWPTQIFVEISDSNS